MSQFSRRAKWLNALFPASVAPQITDPGDVSSDVSLVQQYDAGGLGFSQMTYPAEFVANATALPLTINTPEMSIRDIRTAIGAVVASDFFIIGPDVVCRLYGLGFVRTGGVGTSVTQFRVIAPAGSGISEHQIMLTENVDTVALPNPLRVTPPLYPLLLPGTMIMMQHNTGDAATQYRCTFYMCIAPLGTIFSI